jgi:hypothetical protein
MLNGSIESHFHLMIALMMVFFMVAQGIDVLNAYQQVAVVDSSPAWKAFDACFLIAIGLFRGMKLNGSGEQKPPEEK